MLRWSWVQIPALYTGLTFFTFICCKNCNVCLSIQNKMKKSPGWLSKNTFAASFKVHKNKSELVNVFLQKFIFMNRDIR